MAEDVKIVNKITSLSVSGGEVFERGSKNANLLNKS